MRTATIIFMVIYVIAQSLWLWWICRRAPWSTYQRKLKLERTNEAPFKYDHCYIQWTSPRIAIDRIFKLGKGRTDLPDYGNKYVEFPILEIYGPLQEHTEGIDKIFFSMIEDDYSII